MSLVKKLFAVGIAVLVISAVSVSALAAAEYGSPAEVVAGITGRTQQEVIKEKTETRKTYGQIANEAGVLDEFKAAVLEAKKEFLNAQVAAGKMTQEEANEILAAIAENQAICNGTGGAKVGKLNGANFGSNGGGRGNGNGSKGQNQNGKGAYGQGNGSGLRLQNGSCGK